MVESGLDVLVGTGFEALQGRKLGVLCHHASVDRRLTHLLSHLKRADQKGVLKLVAGFSPEHGLWGAKDSRIEGSNVDRHAGIPVHSLYGRTYRPSQEMLEGIDTFVIDLQDVGARFYTYTWSMAHCLAACAEKGIRAVILDRPNPIGGTQVEGPVLEPAFSSFVGLHPIAQRHGMTHGEMATWIKAQFHPMLDLQVIRARGWQRSQYHDKTGLPWVVPSPNMPRLETAVVYPGTCLFEGTDLSEGRGTTRPFETFGHPEVDGWKLAEHLNAQNLAGATFRPLFFQPTSSKHLGKGCGGCFLHVTNRSKFHAVSTAIAILLGVQKMAPQCLGWGDTARQGRFDRLAGCSWLRESITRGESLHAIQERIESSSKAFLVQRESSLLY